MEDGDKNDAARDITHQGQAGDDAHIINSFESQTSSSSSSTEGGMEHKIDQKTGVVSIRTPATRTKG